MAAETPQSAAAAVPQSAAGQGGSSDAEIRARRRKLTEYVKDPNNPNRGSERGRGIIRESLTKRGAGRSLLSSADDVFIAGNQTMQEALDAGITDVIEVETDGHQLVVVKRTDVPSTDPKFRELGYDDNRSRDFSEWDPHAVQADDDAGLDMTPWFDADEIEDLMATGEAEFAVETAASNGKASRGLTLDKARQIKPVLYVEQVAIVERALKATGLEQRGAAFTEICRFYLDHQPTKSDP